MHTPGPWRLEEDSCNVIANPYMTVAMWYAPQGMSADEAEANAHLIAAAPDMLVLLRQAEEALTYVRVWAEDGLTPTDPVSWRKVVRRIDDTLAAISAALGEGEGV